MELQEILNNLSVEDIQKMKLLSAIFGSNVQSNTKNVFVEQGFNGI